MLSAVIVNVIFCYYIVGFHEVGNCSTVKSAANGQGNPAVSGEGAVLKLTSSQLKSMARNQTEN